MTQKEAVLSFLLGSQVGITNMKYDEALKCFKSTSEGNECLFQKMNEDSFPFKAKKIQSLHFLIFASMYLSQNRTKD